MSRLFYVLWLFSLSIFCSGCYFGGEERRFKQLVQKDFEEQVRTNPEWSSLLGLKSSKSQWSDLSESFLRMRHEKVNENLKKLSLFDVSSFSEKSQASWKIFKLLMEEEKTNFDFRFHPYTLFRHPFEATSFLINVHTIENLQDAKNYILRVRGIQRHLDQVIVRLQESSQRNLMLPRFLFPKITERIKDFLKGRPLDSQEESHILVLDFNKKISSLNLSPLKKRKLNKELEQALLKFYKPSYKHFLNYWQKLRIKSGSNAGLWSQPQGRQYYEFLVHKKTSSDLTPEEIHQMGLKEVQRLHLEITQFKNILKFEGNLLEFLNFFRNSRKFHSRNKEVYLTQSRTVVSEMKKSLLQVFKKLPRHFVKIKRIENFREKTAEGYFYQPPSMTGGRPGIFYVNFYRINTKPKYALKALTFGETLPGRHLQISTALDLKFLPHFQRYIQFPAFMEGWVLYAERLAGEMGFYTETYDQFGVLAGELLRACSLVIDTGIHYKKWSRDHAIGYLIQNSDLSYDSAVQVVEKSIINPGYATAGMMGFLKILELRTLSKQTLKDQFDIKEFHHQVLKNGSLPLEILEESVHRWLNTF